MGVTSSPRKSLTEPLFINVDRCRMHLPIPLSSWMHWKLLVLYVTPLGATEISVLQLAAIIYMNKNILWRWIFFFPSLSLINPCSLRFLSFACLHLFPSTAPSWLGSPELCTFLEWHRQAWKCKFPASFAGTGDVRQFLKRSDSRRHCYLSRGSVLFFLMSRGILGIKIVLTAGIPGRILWKITPWEKTIWFLI